MPDVPQAPPPVETPATLLAAAADRRAQQRWHEGQAAFHEGMARSFASEAESLERRSALTDGGKRLTTPANGATVNAVNASDIDSNALRSRAKAKYEDNAFVRALSDPTLPEGKEARTIVEVADFLTKALGRPFHRNVVQAWYVPRGEPSHRAIPMDAAEALRDYYGKFTSGARKGAWRVPLDSWPRIRGR